MKRFGQSLGRAIALVDAPGLRLRPKPGWVRYSGAITAEEYEQKKADLLSRL